MLSSLRAKNAIIFGRGQAYRPCLKSGLQTVLAVQAKMTMNCLFIWIAPAKFHLAARAAVLRMCVIPTATPPIVTAAPTSRAEGVFCVAPASEIRADLALPKLLLATRTTGSFSSAADAIGATAQAIRAGSVIGTGATGDNRRGCWGGHGRGRWGGL